jgi:hypothetical protein
LFICCAFVCLFCFCFVLFCMLFFFFFFFAIKTHLFHSTKFQHNQRQQASNKWKVKDNKKYETKPTLRNTGVNFVFFYFILFCDFVFVFILFYFVFVCLLYLLCSFALFICFILFHLVTLPYRKKGLTSHSKEKTN